MSLLILGNFKDFPVSPLLFMRGPGGWEGLEISKENFLKCVLCGFSRLMETSTPLPHEASERK